MSQSANKPTASNNSSSSWSKGPPSRSKKAKTPELNQQPPASEEWKEDSASPGTSSNTAVSTTFTLGKGKELVKARSKAGKARGRGNPSGHSKAPPTIGMSNAKPSIKEEPSSTGPGSKYPAPKPGSRGITVIEPLDKEDDEADQDLVEEGQFDEAPAPADQSETVDDVDEEEVEEGHPGLPLRGSGLSRLQDDGEDLLPAAAEDGDDTSSSAESKNRLALKKDYEESAKGADLQVEDAARLSSDTVPANRVAGTGSVQQGQSSKPKRYSSQRQQKGQNTGSGGTERIGATQEQGKVAWKFDV